MDKSITVGLKRVSATVKAFFVRDTSGTERKVYDTDGKLYQVGTALTATAAEINKLASAGAVVASGTTATKIADIANDASGTQIATAVNAIIDALEAFKVSASS